MEANEGLHKDDRLVELGDSNFEIVDGQPDIRSWKIVDINANHVGVADELIFDKTTRKVLYIVANLKGNHLGLKSSQVLVPIGLATLHQQEDEIILAGLASRLIGQLPDYTKGNITPNMESAIRDMFTGLAAAVAAGAKSYQSHPNDFYLHEHFDQDRFFGTRKLKK